LATNKSKSAWIIPFKSISYTYHDGTVGQSRRPSPWKNPDELNSTTTIIVIPFVGQHFLNCDNCNDTEWLFNATAGNGRKIWMYELSAVKSDDLSTHVNEDHVKNPNIGTTTTTPNNVLMIGDDVTRNSGSTNTKARFVAGASINIILVYFLLWSESEDKN
jgi:hypothetical protein